MMRIALTQLIISIFILTGCTGKEAKPTQYYVIDPGKYSNAPLTQKTDIKLEVIDLQLPQYLERFHIATREEVNRLRFSDTHQWAENFRKNLIRTLSRNLSSLLNTNDIATPLGRSASVADYRVQVYLEQFEQQIDNSISLVARWQVSSQAQSEPLGIYSADLKGGNELTEGDYDAMVTEMSQQFSELSRLIAKSILEHADK